MLRLVLVGGTTRRRASICLWRLSSGFGGDGALAPPGRDSGGIVLTIVLGIVGAVVGNWLGRVLGFYRPGEVAAEDKNFFTHSGVEYRVLPRVVHKTATSSLAGWWSGAGLPVHFPQGGSTLTQQLVRVAVGGDEPAVRIAGTGQTRDLRPVRQLQLPGQRPVRLRRRFRTERHGVCRDFQHLALTFLRALTRPRIGRVLMARGRDAVDVALTTSFAIASLKEFSVSANELPAAASNPALLDQGPVRKPHDCE